MTKATVLKQYKHFCNLAEGNFTERDFYIEFPSPHKEGEDGRSSTGKLTPERRLLIVADAKKNKKDMETRTKIVRIGTEFKRVLAFPYLTEKTKPIEKTPKKTKPIEEVKE